MPDHIQIRGARVHTLKNIDYVIDMGPGGGEAGGRIVAAGTPEQLTENECSVTGRYLGNAGKPLIDKDLPHRI